ncbi:MAG: class A beta-lactamase-related serine hydrolase [Clostridiales bacterium]|jgi:hypothetical protein|nr:class A beta-lactamase-related serine hydrolase [Clostridiales bacterium]
MATLVFTAFALFGAAQFAASEYEEEQPRLRHIPWRFITYDAPGFDANPVGDFLAQYVQYHEDNGEGWIAITTYRGEEWVYYRANLRRVSRILGLHNNMGDTAYVDLIAPQLVRVLEQDGRWLKIETHLGPRWINLDFRPPTAALQAALQQHGDNVSVFFKNMETGFTFTYNPERVYFGASTNKIYNALYVYTLAERGLITLDNIHTFTAADYRAGSGLIRHMPFGTRFTTQELLNHSIRYSCNVAYRMLALRYSAPGFTFWDFVDEVGANRARILSLTAKNIDAIDAGIWMTAVFHYLESDGRYAHILREDLIYAFNPIVSDNYDVAAKYGWMAPISGEFHDMAIVYAPSPYILIILSDTGSAPGLGFGPFASISRMFEAFNDRYFR